jgi:hypothetical protein
MAELKNQYDQAIGLNLANRPVVSNAIAPEIAFVTLERLA